MPEIKSDEKHIPAPPQPQPSSVPEAVVPEAMPPSPAPAAATPPGAETKPRELQLPKPPPAPARKNHTWIIVSAVAVLVLFLFLLAVRNRPKVVSAVPPAGSAAMEKGNDLSNYSAFVAKNKAIMAEQPAQVLTDEPFAGQAPLAMAADGPLVSVVADPQLAALAEALKIRVQVMQGSQAFVKDNLVIRVTKGDFRGFKIQAVEKLENGRVVAEEVLLLTPKKGELKTVGRVLTSLQKTDATALLAEIHAAGMDYSPLADEKRCRGQLRLPHYWGKPIPEDRLIFGESVGRVALGMPLVQLKSRIAATDSVLKRKVLINDVYHEVYKVMDQRGEPLFFVYEKEGKVLGIWVVSEAFKTGKGLGVNSSLDQIRIHYPVVSLLRSEKKPPFVKVDGVAGMLIIQGEKEKKVIAVLVGASPEFN